MSKIISPARQRSQEARKYLEWVTSDEAMCKITSALRGCRSTHHIDPVVFVRHRVSGVLHSGAIQASYKLRQLFDIAGPHGNFNHEMLVAIEQDRYPLTT